MSAPPSHRRKSFSQGTAVFTPTSSPTRPTPGPRRSVRNSGGKSSSAVVPDPGVSGPSLDAISRPQDASLSTPQPSPAAATKTAGFKTRPPVTPSAHSQVGPSAASSVSGGEGVSSLGALSFLPPSPPASRLTPRRLMSEELSRPCYSTELSFARVQPPGFDRIVLCVEELPVYRFEPIEEVQAFWLLAHPSVADLTLYVRRRDHLVGQNPAVVLQLLEVARPVLSRFLSDYPSTPLSLLLFQFIRQLLDVYLRRTDAPLPIKFDVPLFPTVLPYFNFCVETYQYSQVERSALAPFQDAVFLPMYRFLRDTNLVVSLDDAAVREQLIPAFRYAAGYLAGGGSTNEPIVATMFNSLQTNALALRYGLAGEPDYAPVFPFLRSKPWSPFDRIPRISLLSPLLQPLSTRSPYRAPSPVSGSDGNYSPTFGDFDEDPMSLSAIGAHRSETPVPITRNKGKGRATSHDRCPASHVSQPSSTSVGRKRELMSHVFIASPPGFSKADYTAVRLSIPVAAKIPLIFGPPKSARVASKILKSSTSRPSPDRAVASVRSLRLRVPTPGPSNTCQSPVNDDGEDELDPADSPPRPPPRKPRRKTQGVMEQDGVSIPEPEDGFSRASCTGHGDSSTKAVGVPLAPVAPRSYEDLVVALSNGSAILEVPCAGCVVFNRLCRACLLGRQCLTCNVSSCSHMLPVPELDDQMQKMEEVTHFGNNRVVAAIHDVDRAAAALASVRTTVDVLTSDLRAAASNLSSTIRSMIAYYGRSNFNWLWRIPDQYADVVFNFIAHETFQQVNPDPEIRNFGLTAAQYFGAPEFSSSDDASWMEFINSVPADPNNRVYQEPLFLGQLLGHPSEEVMLKLADRFKKVGADAGSSSGQT
ncbi:hypothetical protein K438DRAFT_1985362 [Mycena galopus ATCC 62051]|nr:hypothetical protein K438DRAFT_1985362 [Mycena galopus ATCC 62051]